MIVISIIILCANVLKSFSYTFPRSSQVKFGYLVYFLVDLDGKKCTEAKTNRSSFQIKRTPIAKCFYRVFCFSFCASWLMVSTHSPLCFSKSLSPNQHSYQTQVLRYWILPCGSAPLSWFPWDGQRTHSPSLPSFLSEKLQALSTALDPYASLRHPWSSKCFLTCLLPACF